MKYRCSACGRSRKLKDLLIISIRGNGDISVLEKIEEESFNVFVCRDPECLSKLFKEKIFGSADKKIRNKLLKELKKITSYKNKADKLLGMGIRSGKVVRGFTAVASSLKKSEVKIVITSKKQSLNSRQKLISLSRLSGVKVYEYCGEEDFDKVVGKPNCTCVGVKDKDYADLLEKELNEIYDTHSS